MPVKKLSYIYLAFQLIIKQAKRLTAKFGLLSYMLQFLAKFQNMGFSRLF